MGKKKRKNQPTNKKRSDAELIQSAKRASQRGKWKDALAAYKELNKRQPGRYDAALLEVQVQRYKAFLERDMFESADQLLDILRKQLPPDQLKAFELQRAHSLQDTDAVNTLTWQSLEAQSAAGHAFDPACLETLIFSDSPPPPTLTDDGEIKTLLAVRTGLKAICQNQPEPLANAMAAISRQSTLAHWKLILRALDAWYTGQDERLAKCIEKLPGLTGHAARVAEGLGLLHSEGTPATAEALTAALALHGTGTRDTAADLLQTDAYLENNQYAEAFDFAISRFDFGDPHSGAVDQTVLDRFTSILRAGNHDFPEHIEKRLGAAVERKPAWFPFLRAKFAEWELPCDCRECIDDFGQKYLEILAARGASTEIQARAQMHLAEEFLCEVRGLDAPERPRFLLNRPIELLESALELDPQSEKVGMLLFEAYDLANETSAANKLLDQLAAQFTDNPKILQTAGNACIRRGAWVRGLKQLERALTIDPHRPKLKQDYLRGLFQKASNDYPKGNPEKGRICFTTMQPYLQENRQETDYWLDSGLMHLRQLELELSYHGAKKMIEDLRTTAQTEWQDRTQMREALEYLIVELIGSRERQDETREQAVAFFEHKELPKTLPPEQLLQLFRIKKEADLSNHDAPIWSAHLRSLLDAYRMHYQPERLEGMLRIFWETIPEHISPEQMLETCKLWSKADRHHPQLKLLVLMAKDSLREHATDDCLIEVEQVLEAALQRNDQVAIGKGKKFQRQIMDEIGGHLPFSRRHAFAGAEDEVTGDSDYEPEAAEQPEFDFADPDEDLESAERVTNASTFKLMDHVYDLWKNSSGKGRKKVESEVIKSLGSSQGSEAIRTFKMLESKGI